MNKRLKGVFVFVAVLFVLGGVWLYLDTTLVNQIQVSGNRHYSRNEILDYAGVYDSSTIFEALLVRDRHQSNIDYIKTLDIEQKRLKNIYVNVVEKEIIGYVEYMGKYICLDNEGYIIDYTDVLDEGIAIIKGVELGTFTIGDPLEVTNEILESIEAVYRNGKNFNIDIDWIDFGYYNGNYISVYVGEIEFKIGNIRGIDVKFKNMSKVLGVVEGQEGVVYLEDVESDIIFKSKKTEVTVPY